MKGRGTMGGLRAAAWALAAAWLVAGPMRVEAGPAASPLVDVRDADPLELARVVTRLGDRSVLGSLDARCPVAERLAAARASEWLRAPERALGALIDMLVGRDSELAPAAARALVRIAASLDADTLARREVASQELGPARARLLAASTAPALRADLRTAAAQAAEQLRAAGVP